MKKNSFSIYILATIIVVGFYILMIGLIKYPLPEVNKDAALLLFGSLAASFGAVVNYFFGSSKGSSDKNILLNEKAHDSSTNTE